MLQKVILPTALGRALGSIPLDTWLLDTSLSLWPTDDELARVTSVSRDQDVWPEAKSDTSNCSGEGTTG